MLIGRESDAYRKGLKKGRSSMKRKSMVRFCFMIVSVFVFMSASSCATSVLDRMTDDQNRSKSVRYQDSANCLGEANLNYKAYDHPSKRDSDYYNCMERQGYHLPN